MYSGYGGFDGLRLEGIRQSAGGSAEEKARQSRREVSTQIMDTDQCNKALKKKKDEGEDM